MTIQDCSCIGGRILRAKDGKWKHLPRPWHIGHINKYYTWSFYFQVFSTYTSCTSNFIFMNKMTTCCEFSPSANYSYMCVRNSLSGVSILLDPANLSTIGHPHLHQDPPFYPKICAVICRQRSTAVKRNACIGNNPAWHITTVVRKYLCAR